MTANRATAVASIMVCLALSSCIFDRGPLGVGEPSTLTAVTVLQQEAPRGAKVGAAPAVRVRDRNGDPVSGIAVAFEVTAGNGAVSVPAAVTDANGVASSGEWTLGSTPGVNRMTASAAGLPAVTFQAGGLDPCLSLATLPTDGSLIGSLENFDCIVDGIAQDSFILHITSQQSLRFVLSRDLWFRFGLRDVALSENEAGSFVAGTVEILLGPGTYRGAIKQTNFLTGSYSLAVGEVPANLDGCRTHIVTPGITTAQMIVPQVDCHAPNGTYDEYAVHMTEGRTYAISATSLKLIEVWDVDNAGVTGGNAGQLDFPVAFTAPETGDYRIRVIMPSPQDNWSYTVSIQ